MNEAKPQDGTTVKGYRKLGDAEIAAMNKFKAISKEFIGALNSVDPEECDMRWLAMAKTDMQRACMAACRAIAMPDDDS